MLIIEANYSKKLGLPGYSSHQYSITLRAEVSDVSQVSAKSQELHSLMQSCVDREIQTTGYLPGENGNGNGRANGHTNGGDNWACSDKQKELVLKMVDEHKLDKSEVEKMANEMFSKGVRHLNKLEMSGLIDQLFEKTGQKKSRNRFQKAGGR